MPIPGPPMPVGAFGNGRPGGGPPDSYILVIWSMRSCALSWPSAAGVENQYHSTDTQIDKEHVQA